MALRLVYQQVVAFINEIKRKGAKAQRAQRKKWMA